MLVIGVVAIGTGYWAEVYPGLIPVELALFLICSVMIEVLSPCLAISSFKFALIGWIFASAYIEVMDLLRIHVELVEQIRGLILDGRDLNGNFMEQIIHVA